MDIGMIRRIWSEFMSALDEGDYDSEREFRRDMEELAEEQGFTWVVDDTGPAMYVRKNNRVWLINWDGKMEVWEVMKE